VTDQYDPVYRAADKNVQWRSGFPIASQNPFHVGSNSVRLWPYTRADSQPGIPYDGMFDCPGSGEQTTGLGGDQVLLQHSVTEQSIPKTSYRLIRQKEILMALPKIPVGQALIKLDIEDMMWLHW